MRRGADAGVGEGIVSDRLAVNEHYLNRVVAVAETATVEATEDILSGSGLKLVAKGARIDARFRERLLEHKLRKPLETSVRVVDGVASRPIDKVAQALLDQHALLAGVCGRSTARLVLGELRSMRLSTPVESLLSLYAAQAPHKLEHAVGIGLISAASYYDLPEGGAAGLQKLLLAGLVHDIGELYIDPAIVQSSTRLSAEQWRHIAAHPIIGSHVLAEMPGAGPKVAEAVLYHHERLDGFGYPHGLRNDSVPVSGQVLALAEMLMGLMESRCGSGEHASVAVKLIPGEFHRLLLDRVARAAQAVAAADAADEDRPFNDDPARLAAQAVAQGATLQRLHELLMAAQDSIHRGSPALRDLMTHVTERCLRIRSAFSSTGLDTHGIEALREHLAAVEPAVRFEVTIVLREIDWRLREVKRETRLRLERLPPSEAQLVLGLIGQSKEAARQAAEASHATPLSER